MLLLSTVYDFTTMYFLNVAIVAALFYIFNKYFFLQTRFAFRKCHDYHIPILEIFKHNYIQCVILFKIY